MANVNKLLLGLTAFAFLLYSPFPYAAEEETLNTPTAQALVEDGGVAPTGSPFPEAMDAPEITPEVQPTQTPETIAECSDTAPEESNSPEPMEPANVPTPETGIESDATLEPTDAADVPTPEATVVTVAPDATLEPSPTETVPNNENLAMEADLTEDADESTETGSIIAYIPSTIDLSRESAQGHAFNISVSGFDTLSAAMMLEISVSSQNGFSLAGEDGSIAYELRCGANGAALENGSVFARFPLMARSKWFYP